MLLRSSVHFFGPVNYKCFASTRLIASAFAHKFVTHPSHSAPTQKQRAVTRQSTSSPVIRKGPLVEVPISQWVKGDEEFQALESVYDERSGPREVFKMCEKFLDKTLHCFWIQYPTWVLT